MLAKFAAKKKRYNALITTYEARRSKLRERLGIQDIKRPRNIPDEYRRKVKKINIKIRQWKLGIRTVEQSSDRANKRLQGVKCIEKSVSSFLGVKIKGINGTHLSPEVTLAKGIFYKYALENGYTSEDLLAYIKGSHQQQPGYYRKSFTKKLRTNPSTKETWLQFKRFHEAP